MRNRLLALVAAVAMVVVAVQVRARLDEDDTARRPRIVCVTELREICAVLEDDADVRVEPAGVTADRLLAGGTDVGLDSWVTLGPWPALVEHATTPPPLQADGRAIARSPLILAVWPGKPCADDIGWPCLAKAAASGTLTLGFPDARREALGLVALGSAARSLAPDDPLGDETFTGKLDALAEAVPRPLPTFRTAVAAGPSLIDAYVTVEAGAGRRMRPAYPSPMVAVDVLVGSVPGSRGDRADALVRNGRVRDRLVQAGWRADVAGDSGLPTPDVLVALRNLWAEVAR